MVKRIYVVFILVFITTHLFAQRGPGMHGNAGGNRMSNNNNNAYADDDSSKYDAKHKDAPTIIKQARDFLLLELGYNNWLVKPDSVSTKPIGYTFKGFLCYDFPIKHSKMSFATGLGLNVSVVYLNQLTLSNTDTSAVYGATERFVPDTTHFKRYKFVTTYLTAPFELRYFSNTHNRNRGFKLAAGLQIGTLIGAHTKGVYTVDGSSVKLKVDTRRYVSPWDFAATFRIGIGNFAFFASYNLTTVFKVNEGPPITPGSVGFALTGL